ncbi:sodium:proton antiporter [Porphyrobacter sp. SLTP]|uniref:cation:proton antiporter n=1 Tax=Porphyrobacter sp. SLTP TaxID=2683266 RepID=UPI001412A53E|nr:cation:proton antiporter [Porphyrobacter sp. SLTP]NBB23658.1 sodium:proton antiporter [Porphyrobacter sp. SLTP]
MSYHEFLLFAGLAILAAFWLPRFVSGREPAASALLILAGFICALAIDEAPPLFTPISHPQWWETMSEMAVIVALFATGMRLDVVRPFARWRVTWRLLAVAMPLTIGAMVLAGMAVGLPLASALLLGAVLAPTDPVLAGDLQVGPPTEGGEHPVRFALTTEAGLNDGLAFPFVYLAIAALGGISGTEAFNWLSYDVAYRIAAGAVSGGLTGWLLGQVVFRWPMGNILAETGSGVLALAGVLVCYGAAEFIHGYGFVACFVGGMAFRRVEAKHSFHSNLHLFNLAIEHALTAVLLLMTGAALGTYAAWVEWKHVAIAASLIFLVRPLSGWVALAGSGLPPRERFVTAAFGVRGIGSLYYLAFAASAAPLAGLTDLWLIVLLAIALSALVHGLSAAPVLAGIRADTASEPQRRPRHEPEQAQ